MTADGESAVMVSSALATTRTVQFFRSHMVKQFGAILGTVDRYEWRFIRRGSVLVDYDDRPPLLADTDYVELHAFGGSA